MKKEKNKQKIEQNKHSLARLTMTAQTFLGATYIREFPADCPIHDCRVRVHFTARVLPPLSENEVEEEEEEEEEKREKALKAKSSRAGAGAGAGRGGSNVLIAGTVEVYDTRTDPAVQVAGGGRGAAEEKERDDASGGGGGGDERGRPFEFHLGCGVLPEALETSIRLMAGFHSLRT